jgi:hypothetical protein
MTREADEALNKVLDLLLAAGLTPADVTNIGHAVLGWGLSYMEEERRTVVMARLPNTIDNAIEQMKAAHEAKPVFPPPAGNIYLN